MNTVTVDWIWHMGLSPCPPTAGRRCSCRWRNAELQLGETEGAGQENLHVVTGFCQRKSVDQGKRCSGWVIGAPRIFHHDLQFLGWRFDSGKIATRRSVDPPLKRLSGRGVTAGFGQNMTECCTLAQRSNCDHDPRRFVANELSPNDIGPRVSWRVAAWPHKVDCDYSIAWSKHARRDFDNRGEGGRIAHCADALRAVARKRYEGLRSPENARQGLMLGGRKNFAIETLQVSSAVEMITGVNERPVTDGWAAGFSIINLRDTAKHPFSLQTHAGRQELKREPSKCGNLPSGARSANPAATPRASACCRWNPATALPRP
jgi:hypothetical protein